MRRADLVARLGAVGCAASLLVSTHVILFRRTALAAGSPTPWVLLSALLFLVAVLGANRATAQLTPWLRWLRLRRAELAMAMLFFVLLAAFGQTFERATGDGRDMVMQTRSVVIDRDLDFSNEIETFRTNSVTWVMPPGAPTMWVPFFAAAHGWIKILGVAGFDVQADGYWNPYQQAAGLGTLLLGYLGLLLLFLLLREDHDEGLAALVVWAFTLGTFVLYYLTVEATYAHGIALFAVALFVYLVARQGAERTARQQFVLGLAAGLMVAARWENAVFLLLPVFHDAGRIWRALLARRWSKLVPYLAAPVGALVTFSPQIAIWGEYQQRYITLPELWGEQWWDNALPMQVLFSSDRGLMTWHPLFFFAALGLPFAWKSQRRLLVAMVGAVAVLVYANVASNLWAGGSGFGYRRLMVAVPLFAFGLAGLAEILLRRPRALLAAMLAAIVSVNLAMMAGVRQGRLPIGEGSTADVLVGNLFHLTGNPFAAPKSLWYWMAHGIHPRQLGLLGRRQFNNVDIAVGEAGDEPFLLRGWGNREQTPGGETFRWVVADSATLAAPLKELFTIGSRNPLPDYVLEIAIEPFGRPDGQAQELSVLVNDAVVAGDLVLRPGIQDLAITVDSRYLVRYLNFFELRFDWAESPRSLGISEDDRNLAARITRIFLRRTER